MEFVLLNLRKAANGKIHVIDFLEVAGKGGPRIHIYEEERGKQTLVIDVDASSHSDVYTYLGVRRALPVRPVYKKRNLAGRHLDGISFPFRSRKVVFERVARRSGRISLRLPSPAGSPLGTGPGIGRGE